MTNPESAVAIVAAVRRRQVSAQEMVARALERIEALDGPVNSCIQVLDERAPDEAARIDSSGDTAAPLAGVPIAVKEIFAMEGERTTWGCPGLRQSEPAPADDPYVARLREAGAVVVARTNIPELSCWGHTDNPVFGQTRNPWDLSRTPGGSSGGSAAAVSLGIVPLALGSDAGGSIRVPAAFSGTVGLKPSFTAVPAERAAWISRLNCVGPLASCVADAAACFDVLVGERSSGREPGEARIGATEGHGFAPVAPDVREGFRAALARLSDGGLSVTAAKPPPESPLPFMVPMLECEVYDAFAEVLESADHGLSRETVAVAEIGRCTTGREYARALLARHRFEETWKTFFASHDVLLSPTTQLTAFGLGKHGPDSIDGHAVDPDADGSWYPTAFIANVIGAPAVSVPSGLSPEGLPLAIQVTGRPGDDRLVLSVAAQLERILGPLPAPPAARPNP